MLLQAVSAAATSSTSYWLQPIVVDPWFNLGIAINGLNLGAENETVYVIGLALPVVAALIALIASHYRQDIYTATLAMALTVVTFMLFGFVFSHTASGILSDESRYYAVLRLSEYSLGFFVILVGQALSLVSGLANLVLKSNYSPGALPVIINLTPWPCLFQHLSSSNALYIQNICEYLTNT